MIIWSYKSKFKYLYYSELLKYSNCNKLINYTKNRGGRNYLKITVFSKGWRIQQFTICTFNTPHIPIYGFVQLFIYNHYRKFLLLKLLSGRYIWLPASAKTQLNQCISNYQPRFYYNAPISLIKLTQPVKFHTISTQTHTKFSCAPGTFSINISNIAVILPSQQKIAINQMMVAILGQRAIASRQHCYYHNAGKKRQYGYKPIVKGIVMNAVAHPHGGNSGPTRSSRSPWGKYTK